MLNRLSINNISQIRQHYQNHVLFMLLKQSFPHGISGRYALSTEQVFVELIRAIDLLKKDASHQNWDTFYQDLKQDYSLHCEDLPEENLDGIVSTIIMYLAILLVYPYGIYSNIGHQLIGQYTHYNKNRKQRIAIDNIISIVANSKELREWFYAYMHSDESLSGVVETLCLANEQTTHTHRFKYLKPNINEDKRNEIEEDLHLAATSKGVVKALKAFAKKHNDYITLPAIVEDLMQELTAYYGYTKSVQTLRKVYK